MGEYETDTDPESEEEEKSEEEKEEAELGTNEESVKENGEEKKEVEEDKAVDQSVDDVLKLEATAEMDEFDKMLNEFEDEVLTEKVTERSKVDTNKISDKSVIKSSLG